jgi:hypothetical protein
VDGTTSAFFIQNLSLINEKNNFRNCMVFVESLALQQWTLSVINENIGR